jgi:hypothetical protein
MIEGIIISITGIVWSVSVYNLLYLKYLLNKIKKGTSANIVPY